MSDILFNSSLSTITPVFSYDTSSYSDFYFRMGEKSGLFIRLQLKNIAGRVWDKTALKYYPNQNQFKYNNSGSWSQGDILGISLFSISKKIYAINGVYNNVNTQYVITTGVYSGSSTTTRQYYWFVCDRTTIININTSTGIILWGNQSFSSVSNIIFIDPTSWVFDQYLQYIDTEDFRAKYPIYKDRNSGKYYLTQNATAGNYYYFLTTNGDCFRLSGTMSQLSWDMGNTNNKKVTFTYNDNDAPIGSGHEISQSSELTKEPQRYLLGQYATQSHQLGIIPYIQDNMKGYVYKYSPIRIKSASYTRDNPLLLWNGTSNKILWHGYGDQFVFLIVTDNCQFYMYRTPSNWVIRKYERRGISLSSSNITINEKIDIVGAGVGDFGYRLIADYGKTESQLLLHTDRDGNIPSIKEYKLNTNFSNAGGLITYTTLSEKTDSGGAPSYQPCNVKIDFNLSFDWKYNTNRGTIGTYHFYDTSGGERLTHRAVPVHISCTISDVPKLPGCDAPTNYSPDTIKVDLPDGGYNYWPDKEVYHDQYCIINAYLDNKPSTGLVGTSKSLLDVDVILRHSQNGIVRSGWLSLIKDASYDDFNYYPDSSHSSVATTTVDKIREISGNEAAIKFRVSGNDDTNNGYAVSIVAYPIE